MKSLLYARTSFIYIPEIYKMHMNLRCQSNIMWLCILQTGAWHKLLIHWQKINLTVIVHLCRIFSLSNKMCIIPYVVNT